MKTSFQPGTTFDLLDGDDGDLAQVQFTYGNPQLATVQGTLLLDADYGDPETPCHVWGFVQSH